MMTGREHDDVPPSPQSGEEGCDERGVAEFAKLMAYKLEMKRADGRGGWRWCHPLDLAMMLVDHIPKGDPIDIANFAMFLCMQSEWAQPVSLIMSPAVALRSAMDAHVERRSESLRALLAETTAARDAAIARAEKAEAERDQAQADARMFMDEAHAERQRVTSMSGYDAGYDDGYRTGRDKGKRKRQAEIDEAMREAREMHVRADALSELADARPDISPEDAARWVEEVDAPTNIGTTAQVRVINRLRAHAEKVKP